MMQTLTIFINEFLSLTARMAPWLLLGFLFAGLFALFFTPDKVRRHLGGKGLLPVLKAVLLGVPLPLCSCGVVPVAAAMRSSGASRGATAAFLISTPQTGIDSMVATFSLLGWLAGVLYRKGVLRRSRLSLCIFGVIASTVLYGGIMNPVSALLWSNTINWKIILSYYVTGIPIDLVRALATFLFLWLTAEPLLQKLDRIKTKYALAE